MGASEIKLQVFKEKAKFPQKALYIIRDYIYRIMKINIYNFSESTCGDKISTVKTGLTMVYMFSHNLELQKESKDYKTNNG